jgi:FkbM family methyltransferase
VRVPDQLAIFRVHDAQKTKWREGEDYPEHVAVGRLYAEEDRDESSGSSVEVASSGGGDGQIDIQETIPKSIFDRRPVMLCDTSVGRFYVPVDSIQDEACNAIRQGSVYREEIVKLAAAYVRPGTTVLDVGSGVGQLAMELSKAAGPDGQVFAFEADEYLFDILVRNRDLNRAENLRVFHGVVFDSGNRELVFPKIEYLRFPSYCTQRVDPKASSGARVPTIGIDSLAIQGPVSLLHVHAPGSELEVIRGARATIRKNRMPIVLELDEGPLFVSWPVDVEVAKLSEGMVLSLRWTDGQDKFGEYNLPVFGPPSA